MKILIKIRKWSQLFFFLVSAVLFYLFITNTLQVIHKFCPFSLICFGTLSGKTGQWIYPLSLLIFGLLTLSAIWLGRWFCGFVCIFGTLQEWIYRLFHKKCQPVLKINKLDEKRLAAFKYIVLLATVILSLFGLSRIYMAYCPVMISGWIKTASVYGISFILLVLAGSIFIERLWCRYLCPYAALMNLMAFVGRSFNLKRWRLKRNLETCIDCGICSRFCPMYIDLLEEEEINNLNCIKCFRCIDKCPKKGTIN